MSEVVVLVFNPVAIPDPEQYTFLDPSARNGGWPDDADAASAPEEWHVV